MDLGQTFQETLARIKGLCKVGESIPFSRLTRKVPRRLVATQFYDLLVYEYNVFIAAALIFLKS